jgi:N-acetylmuramoyl-L-alanine amidase-like protein
MRANRRSVLRWLASGAALAVGAVPTVAGEARVTRLIAATQAFPAISARIDFISAALRGTRYMSDTLIGGPRRPEKFVVRDDAFDCVTFCETVLAAARAHDAGDFEAALQDIRYRQGFVNWYERNHYFFEWCEHNVENKIFRWLALDGAVDIKKTVDSQRGLSKRHFAMRVIPSAVLLANAGRLATGDIVGFVSRRASLDYFHCGFAIAVPKYPLLLRHAAESRRRVLDERMDRFLAHNRVRYVTLLRPEEPAAAVAVKKAI